MSYDDFHSDQTIKATRKVHECEQCGQNIAVGSPAIYGVGKYDGYFYSQHQHIECHEAGMAYAKETSLWGEEFTWFQHLSDDMYDDVGDWLLEHFPVVATRIGYEKEVAA